MVEVLVSGGILCAFCGIWIKSHIRNKVFDAHMDMTGKMLDNFIKINDVEWMDYELHNISEASEIKKKYIDTSLTKQIGKDIDTGYDLFHITVDDGYNTLLHRHIFSNEFFYVLDGEITVTCTNEKPIILSAGDYFYIGNKKFHCITANSHAEFIVIAKPPVIVGG